MNVINEIYIYAIHEEPNSSDIITSLQGGVCISHYKNYISVPLFSFQGYTDISVNAMITGVLVSAH